MKNRFRPALLTIQFAILHITFYGQSAENIKLNQLGFYPHAEKIAVVTGEVSSNRFYVLNLPSRDTVYKAALNDTLHSKWSAPVTRIARFSSVTKPGPQEKR